MRSADEIAAEIELIEDGVLAAKVRADIAAAITAARREGAEQMRDSCARIFANYWNFDFVGKPEHTHTLDDLQGCLYAIRALPLPGDEPKETGHAK